LSTSRDARLRHLSFLQMVNPLLLLKLVSDLGNILQYVTSTLYTYCLRHVVIEPLSNPISSSHALRFHSVEVERAASISHHEFNARNWIRSCISE
jgi:hypothetical protein